MLAAPAVSEAAFGVWAGAAGGGGAVEGMGWRGPPPALRRAPPLFRRLPLKGGVIFIVLKMLVRGSGVNITFWNSFILNHSPLEGESVLPSRQVPAAAVVGGLCRPWRGAEGSRRRSR